MIRTLFRMAAVAALLSFCTFVEAVINRTVITSETVEMQGTETRNYFYFRNNVVVEGINLELRCDELTVVSLRRAGADDGETVGEIGSMESIVAVGNVEIYQSGRSAFAGRAEVNPAEGTVTLKENPRIVDRDVEVQGYQFVLNQGERRFQSIPDPNAPEDQPSRSVVRLGALPDLGFDQDDDAIDIGSPVIEAENEAVENIELESEEDDGDE